MEEEGEAAFLEEGGLLLLLCEEGVFGGKVGDGGEVFAEVRAEIGLDDIFDGFGVVIDLIDLVDDGDGFLGVFVGEAGKELCVAVVSEFADGEEVEDSVSAAKKGVSDLGVFRGGGIEAGGIDDAEVSELFERQRDGDGVDVFGALAFVLEGGQLVEFVERDGLFGAVVPLDAGLSFGAKLKEVKRCGGGADIGGGDGFADECVEQGGLSSAKASNDGEVHGLFKRREDQLKFLEGLCVCGGFEDGKKGEDHIA